MESAKQTVLVALGGHAFIEHGQKGTFRDHQSNAAKISRQLQMLVQGDYQLVITHGNGPQVGNLLLQNEAATVPPMPMDVLVAQTEGSLGYFLQQAMMNELARQQIKREVFTIVTQVLVDPADSAFQNPTKPVGPFMSQEDAEKCRVERGWSIVDDSGRGFRRVVPSPKPKQILQGDLIIEAARKGHIVIACGGGGIPVKQAEDGTYEGIEAVIDKDLSSAILANQIGARLFVILTEVPQVYINFKKPDQEALSKVSKNKLMELYEEGYFPPGSMGPKVLAACDFLNKGGAKAIITNPETLEQALKGNGGTQIT